MNVDDIILKRARYRINRVALNIPGREPYEVDKSLVGSIYIEKDYDQELFPFFVMEVTVPNSVARQMRKNNQDITVSIDIQMGLFGESDEDNNRVSWQNGLNGEFYVVLDDNSPEINEEMQEQIEKLQGTYNNDGMGLNDYTIYRLLLYKAEEVFNSLNVVNEVHTSSTLIDALTATLNSAGISNVLISPPSNYKAYREFKLVPITTREQIYRICNGYGMHTKGSVIFFDFDRNYIIERKPECTAWSTNEIKKTYLIHFPVAKPASVGLPGCYTNSQDKYYVCNITENSIQVHDRSLDTSAAEGNTVLHINEVNGSTKTVSSNIKKSKFATDRVTKVISRANGDDTSAALARVQEESPELYIGLKYIDLKMFKPNKEFIFSTDDSKKSKYNGSYRLSKCVINMVKEGGYLVPNVAISLKK